MQRMRGEVQDEVQRESTPDKALRHHLQYIRPRGKRMSNVYCWQCGKDYGKSEVFDIPVFRKGFTIVWCFQCAKKQLRYTDYHLKKRREKK